jgi:hypothetical protein
MVESKGSDVKYLIESSGFHQEEDARRDTPTPAGNAAFDSDETAAIVVE